ncbi:MAG TPA: DUF4097 family beta strand repeat-containing protein, partial [Gemmatimonadales bacterium]|nr:DUF4097 family beta strand repeat-containing protein [Gemmatimonadales bacterium]
MRTISLLALSLAALPAEAQQRQVVGRPAAPTAVIRILNPAGAVRLTGWSRDSVVVITTLADQSQRLHVTGGGDSLSIGIEAGSGGGADLELRVPAGADLRIKTSNGEIDADGLTGTVTALTVAGRLRVGGKVRSVTAESLEGNIEVAADAAQASVRAGSGSVVVRGAVTDAVATSVSGQLLIGLTGPLTRGRFESLSGDVAYKGPLAEGGTLELQSHSGNLELRMSPTLGATYDIDTYGGSIKDLLSGQSPRTLTGSTSFVIGDGKARV